MAVRIPVVISQHERRSGSMADYEEKMITRLILENGLDATIINDLKSIALDTTDHLCIEGLKGDFAIASWESPQYVQEHLHRLGMPSIEMVPVDGSPKIVSITNSAVVPKKVFFVPLALSTSIDVTIGVLRGLREARSTPVFSIGIQPKREVQATSGTSTSGTAEKTPSSIAPIPIIPSAPTNPGATDRTPLVVAEDDDFPNIDQLMVDLDQFEI